MAIRFQVLQGVWDPAKVYTAGQYVAYQPDGLAYVANADTLPGEEPTVSNKWDVYTPIPERYSTVDSDLTIYALIQALVVHQSAQLEDDDLATMVGGSLGGAWSPLTNWQGKSFVDEGIVTDPVAGTMQFKFPGRYLLWVDLEINHNESNQGRETELRLFNTADSSVVADTITIGIGRNQPTTNYGPQVALEVTTANTGDPIRLEMGNGSSITVLDGGLVWGVCSIGSWSEAFDTIAPPPGPT